MKTLSLTANLSKIAATGQREEWKDSQVRGLRLRVSAAGLKTWSLLYCPPGGGFRRLDLGAFPDVSLAVARENAKTEKSAIRKGADPQKAKAATEAEARAKRAAPLAGSVGATVAAYLDTRRTDLRSATLREWDRLAARIADAFGPLSVKDLDRLRIRAWLATLRSALDPHRKDESGKPLTVKGYTANRSLALLRLALDWAADEGTITANPAAGIKPPSKRHKKNSDILARETKRKRALSVGEVRAVLLALDALEKEAHRAGEGGATADALRLALQTGKRRSGVLGLRRSELTALDDPEPLWEVPAGREKSDIEHDVPLSPEAVAIIRRRLAVCDKRLSDARAEKSASDSRAKIHASVGTCLWATHRDPKAIKVPWWSVPEHPQQWLPQRFIKKLKARAAQIYGGPMKPWTPHALRATFATINADNGVDSRIVSLMLNHRLDDVSVSLGYNLSRKMTERREALKAWSKWLAAVRESEAGTILHFEARKA